MAKNRNYNLGLLYMVHLLISSDGEISETERNALAIMKQKESIGEDVFAEFNSQIAAKKEREIYQLGIDCLNHCSEQEKLEAFGHLYHLSEVDGNVHVKEVRLLLYSIKMTGIEFNDVVEYAKSRKK